MQLNLSRTKVMLALYIPIIGLGIICCSSAPTETQISQIPSTPNIHPPQIIENSTSTQTPSTDGTKTFDPNWPLLQIVLDRALARAGDQLAKVEWENHHRILLSLNYHKDFGNIPLAAVEYLRAGLREQIESVSTVSVVEEIEDNLLPTDTKMLYQLGRTLDVDAFLLVDILSIGFVPLDEHSPSTPEFQAEALVGLGLSLFEPEQGYYLWIGDLIYETYEGKYIVHLPTMPTVLPSQDDALSLVPGEPYALVLQPGVTQRNIVWSPDSQFLLFSSGSIKEVDELPRFVGNIWLSDLNGQIYQLTYLGDFESPWIYTFLPNGEKIILVTSNDIIQIIDREGRLLRSTSLPSDLIDFWKFKPIPGKLDLLAIETSTSSEDPDGLWVFNLKSEAVHTFAELHNNGQMVTDIVKEKFLLRGDITLSDFAWSTDGQALAFTANQWMNDTWHRTFFRFDLVSRELTLLGTVAATTIASGPAFSPKADRAAVAVMERNACLLIIVGVGESLVPINDAGCAFEPVWSPDGAWIVYAYTQGQEAPIDVWIMSDDGSQPHPIVEIKADSIGELVWSPNGEYLALSARVGDNTGIWIVPITWRVR